jgi:STE24 endopeptidase
LEPQLLAILILYLAVEAVEQFLLTLNYTVAHGRLDRIEAVLSTGITLLFLFGGLLNWLNNLIATRGWTPVISGLVFFMMLIYANTLIKMPFSLYSTFSLEKRFGFSNETLSLWVQDFLKSLFVNTLLAVFLLYGILGLVMALPDMWWLAGWIFVLLFSIFLLYVSPYFIEPLFNKFSPIEDAALEERIKKVMSRIGLKINRVFTMDASKRSSHSNAYFTGIGHVKRIVLFDTLLSNHADDEIISILAHEAGHWKKKHVLKMLAFSQAVALVGFYAAYRLTAGDFLTELFRLDIPSMHAKLLLLALFPLKPVMAYLSRRHEIEADNFALQLTQMPVSMANGLIKLGKDNLANLHPHPWYALVYYSHPPLAQRVQRILAAKDNGLPGPT